MNAIEIRDLQKSYARKKGEPFYALRDLNLTAVAGKVFCLLGPNGSGKTTTVNMINGLSRPTGGEVRVMGLDPSKEMRKVRRLLSVVPQETALYNDLTGRENLLFHVQYYGVEKAKWKRKIDEMLELVGLSARQYDRVGTYSGGMQRRLSLARALVTSPELILLDEPTLGVDVQSRTAIWKQIRQFTQEGKTVFLTTNYMEEAEFLADEIMIIDQGKQVIHGTVQSLKNRIQQNVFVLQFATEQAAERADLLLQADYSISRDYNSVSVQLTDKQGFFKVLRLLDAISEQVTGFQMKEPTLNDVFLHFTGRQLRN